MSTPNAPLHRPTPTRAACYALALALLSVTSTACAQEAPPPGPGGEWPHRFDGLVSADVALDRIEADLAAGRSVGTPTLFRSISANGDSARHFARTLRLARPYTARYQNGVGSNMLRPLRAMGAPRPFFRALVFEAAQDPGMAIAAIHVLADDPRQEEYEEFHAFGESLPRSPSAPGAVGVRLANPLAAALSEYGSSLGEVREYEEIRTVRGKLDFLRTSVVLGGWYESQFRALYVEHPAEVEAWISSLVIEPPDPLAPFPQPPDWVIRRSLLDVAQAPATLVLPPTIEGPLLPLSPLALSCNGLPATVYVSDARIVGGPLAGTLYAGRLVGTPGADVVVGTTTADAIEALDGGDTICALGGDDAIDAGPGTDTVDGGPGADGCDASESASACETAVTALPDVRPVLECVAETPTGFTAYFGYENRSPTAGRLAYGAQNQITPAAFDRQQPSLFGLPSVVAGRPGRTPVYPGHAFAVPFQPGQSVVWRLGSRTSTASASSARCSTP